RRELIVPLQFSRVRVERDDRIGVEVVAGPLLAVVIRADVADAPVRQIQLRSGGAGQPNRSAAVFPRVGIAKAFALRRTALPRVRSLFAWRRNRVEAPRLFSCRHVIRGNESADAVLAAADADDHLVLDDERRVRDRVPRLRARDLALPE